MPSQQFPGGRWSGGASHSWAAVPPDRVGQEGVNGLVTGQSRDSCVHVRLDRFRVVLRVSAPLRLGFGHGQRPR